MKHFSPSSKYNFVGTVFKSAGFEIFTASWPGDSSLLQVHWLLLC